MPVQNFQRHRNNFYDGVQEFKFSLGQNLGPSNKDNLVNVNKEINCLIIPPWYFRKYERTTHEQLQFFIAFSKKYPNILKNSYGAKRHHIQDLWNQLANDLNNIRGPKRSTDKWKECLKNRINQIRCRARKSMLGWNRRSANTKKHGLVIDNGELKAIDKPIIAAEINSPKQIHMVQSFNPDGIIVKNEIPQVEPDNRDSNQSFLYMDMDTSNPQSNHFATRESDISSDHLRMLIAFVKQYDNVDCDIQNNIDLWDSIAESLNSVGGSTYTAEKWKDILVKWKPQSQDDNWSQRKSSNLEQEALQSLEFLMMNEKSNLEPFIKENLGMEDVLVSAVKEEPAPEHYSETQPSLSDNEDDDFLNRTTLNCEEDNSSISANNFHSPNIKQSPCKPPEPLPKDFMDLIRECVCRRDEREERAIAQHELLTKSLLLLNKNLETLTSAIEKFNEKLDKL